MLIEVEYLNVPFEEIEELKAAAGRFSDGEPQVGFDTERKLWYAKPGADLSRVDRWRGTADTAQYNKQISDFIEFASSYGLIIDGPLKFGSDFNSVPVKGNKKGRKSGRYKCQFIGNVLYGYVVNFFNGEQGGGFAGCMELDRNAMKVAQAKFEQARIAAETKAAATYAHSAARCALLCKLLKPAHNNGYLKRKGVKPYHCLQDKKGRLVVPLRDRNGITTLQRISSNGHKRLKKGGRKLGSFHIINKHLMDGADVILFGEGYSTCASLAEAAEFCGLRAPVVMTIDSGNMPTVARTISEMYPGVPMLFCGDDDIRDDNPNVGRLKATEAASLAEGVAVFPRFSSRAGGDFNDLHQREGISEVAKQIQAGLSLLRQ